MFQFPWVSQPQNQSDKDTLFNVHPDGKSDDVAADELLSRFPEFGSTATNASITSSSGNDNDWYDDEHDKNTNNDPYSHHDFMVTNDAAWNDTTQLYRSGISLPDMSTTPLNLTWRRTPSATYEASDRRSGDGTKSIVHHHQQHWWNHIPMLPGNVPMFAGAHRDQGTEETKTGEPTASEAAAIGKATNSGTYDPKGFSTSNSSKDSSNMSNTNRDIHKTPWDPMEQTLWKPRPATSTPDDRSISTCVANDQRRSRSYRHSQRQWIADYYQNHQNINEPRQHISPSIGKDRRTVLVSTNTPPRTRTGMTASGREDSTHLTTGETSPNRQRHHQQNWMPDDLYKNCTNCDVPFTLFRRKHHCRDCGQIFCHGCSSYYVVPPHAVAVAANPSDGPPPSVRVCRSCYNQHEQNQTSDTGGNGTNDGWSPSMVGRATVSSSMHGPDQRTTHTDQNPSKVPPPPPPPPIMKNEQTPKRSHVSLPPQGSIAFVHDYQRQIQEGNVHMGMMAADHLELMARDLLRLHAPLIWNHQVSSLEVISSHQKDVHIPIHIKSWVNALLSLATRCCATVNPNVKRGDLLDVRPYVKVKVIPGGRIADCAYLSGVMFRKTVSHKRMAREVLNPKILLLSGGIDFVRNTESRISSLETLFEQEDKYMELLVNKILKLQPDIVLVGRSVNRKAQELLLKANVILIQHVKMTLLNRIARQANAKIVSSTDHHMLNQLSVDVLGTCCRFRLVTFRDNEAWTDGDICDKSKGKLPGSATPESTSVTTPVQTKSDLVSEEDAQGIPRSNPRSIRTLLADRTLTNHQRQAVLAAKRLGETVLDGAAAVRAGLAKRGVTHTYVMLEGCPKHLGCTVVLRGANRAALKQLKGVFRFLANCAYNVRLETTYLKERGARLRPDLELHPTNAFSSSLCVDYGQPPDGRKVRPWNGGGKNEVTLPRVDPGELSPLDHQSILITSVWMTDKTQCCPAEVKGICYYSQQDVALGQFLRDSCFNLSLKCQNPNCKKSVLDHSLSFVHNDGLINIVVRTSILTIVP